MKNIVIVGGGMAGMVCAITAAQNGCRVTLLERQDSLGKKILMTGNGRCNLSNTYVSYEKYLTDRYELLKSVLQSFRKEEPEFWNSLGLLCKEKNGGIYPLSNQASTVLQVLKNEIERLGIKVICNAKALAYHADSRELLYENGARKEKISFDRLVLTCGGMAGVYQEMKENGYDITRDLGLAHEFCYPALTPVKCKGNFDSIAGVRCDADVSLFIDQEFIAQDHGELQITAGGLSGIPVFQLSLFMGKSIREHKDVQLVVDFLPEYSADDLMRMLLDRSLSLCSAYKKHSCTYGELLDGIFQEKLKLWILSQNHISSTDKADILIHGRKGNNKDVINRDDFDNDAINVDIINKEIIEQIVLTIKRCAFPVKELSPFKNAQVSTGGVLLSELTESLNTKKYPDLYLAGEQLNVTGKCGGYNLYFAAASGWRVGNSVSAQPTT